MTGVNPLVAEFVKALGGRGHMARCPVHKNGNERTPSLSVHTASDGKLLIHCKAGCSQSTVWQALKDRGLVGGSGNRHAIHSRPQEACSMAQRRAEVRAIWKGSGPPPYSPAAEYFPCLGITNELPSCIRYDARAHALVALVQARDGTLSGVQRIYLSTDQWGTWKRRPSSKGIIKGGAVRLTPPAHSIQLCESVEDGLALLQMTGRPTWAVPGASFMAIFEPPPEVREIILAPDHDKAGLDAIAKTAASLMGIKLRQLLPPENLDWCDVLEDYDERLAIQEEPAPERNWVEEFVDVV